MQSYKYKQEMDYVQASPPFQYMYDEDLLFLQVSLEKDLALLEVF